MTEKLFKECLTNFKKYSDWEHKLYELGVNFWEQEDLQNMLTSFLDLIAYSCKDESDPMAGTLIEYFIYECDWGNNAEEYPITEADGTEIKLTDIDTLWKYLVKCHPEIEDKDYKEPKKSSCANLSTEDLADIFIENFTKG